MLRSLVRRAVEPSKPPFNIHANPYKAKRLWPPDFTQLPQKHQFRLERKFRRRSQLKWARPRWNKFVQLAQWAVITSVVIYSVLFMEWSEDMKAKSGAAAEEPFHGIRSWFRRTTGSLWSKPTPKPEDSQSSSSAAS